jgi:hypothetical protein
MKTISKTTKTITDDNRNQLSSFRISQKIIGLYQLKMAKDDKDGNPLLFGFDNRRGERRKRPSLLLWRYIQKQDWV